MNLIPRVLMRHEPLSTVKRGTAARLNYPFNVMFVCQSDEPDVMKHAVFQRSR